MKPFCFSLSGIYESEGYAWEQAGKIWDLRELRELTVISIRRRSSFWKRNLAEKKKRKSCRGSAFWIPAIITI